MQLFLVGSIRISLKGKYSWNESISYQKIQSDYITLPSKEGIPDYSLMENFMKNIEFEKIQALETFLKSIKNCFNS